MKGNTNTIKQQFISRKQHLLLLLLLLFLLPASNGMVAAQQNNKQHVLILNSYHQGFSWTNRVVTGINEIFTEAGSDAEIHIEYMDTKRLFNDEYLESLYSLYKGKYAAIPIDVIIVSDNNGLDFLRTYGEELFPATPIVFTGINNFSNEQLVGFDQITGVAEETDIVATLSLMLRLHPGTEQIYVVNDQTPTGIATIDSFNKVKPQFTDQVEFILLDDFAVDELQQELAALPDNSLILMLLVNRDNTGQFYTYEESLDLLSKDVQAPIYGVWDFYIGHGIVGGKLTAGINQGRAAGEMALRILQGEKAANIPVLRDSPNQYMFDHEQLQRFGISESQLPEDSQIVNKPISFYEQYKVYLWLAIVTLAILVTAVVVLLVINARRRRAEEALEVSHQRRGRQVTLSTQVTQDITGITDLNELFHSIVREIKEQFGYYHTQILQYDPQIDAVRLIAGYGEIGTQMLNDGHQMPLGIGLIGRAAATGETLMRSVLIDDPDWKPNPLLPETQGEIAVPIKLGDEIIGVLDVQSKVLGALDEDDQFLLEGLCGQIAVAVEHVRALAEIRTSEERFSLVVAASNNGVWDWDISTNVVYFSTRWKEMLGYADDEIANDFAEFENRIHPEDHDRMMQAVSDYMAGLTNEFQHEFRMQHKDGSYRWILVRALVKRDAQGNPLRMSGSHADITYRKVTEFTLAKQAQEMETVANLSTQAALIQEPQTLLETVVAETQRRFNLYHCHIFLLDEHSENLQIKACGWHEDSPHTGTHGDTVIPLAMEQSLVAQAARLKKVVVVNDVRNDPDWLPNALLPDTQSEMAVPMIAGGRVLGVLDVQSEVANRFSEQDKQIQLALAAQTAVALQNVRSYEQTQKALEDANTFRQLVTMAGQGVGLATMQGEIIYLNPTLQEIMQIEDAEAVVGQPMFPFYPEDIQLRFQSEIIPTVLAEGQWLGELRMEVNGRSIPTLENYYTLRDETGQPTMFVAMISDISERKAAEATLQEAQARSQATLEAINVPLLISGIADGKIHYANQSLADLVSVPLQVLLETGTPDFYVNKGDRAAVVGQIQEQGFVINYELLLKQADGTPFWGLLSAQLLTFDGVPAILTTILDITDRKEAEKVQQELSQNLSERLEEMNALQRAVTREGWSDFLASGKHTVQGFMFGNDELHPVAAGKLNESLPAAPIDFESVTEISVSPEKAAMNVPLNLYGESIGVIGARTQSGEPLSEEQQVLLKELSEQVTEALERARLFEETEVARTQTEKALAETAEQARRRAVLNLTSEQLNRAGTLDDIFNIIAENTAQILPSDRVSLAILDDDKENFTVMSLAGAGENVPVQVEQSLAGSFIEKAIETSDILVTHDAEPSAIGIRSSMIVPLITGTGTIGTLNVGSKETHAYDDGDQSLALQIASLLSSVIVNKRLLTETEERAKELALINRVVAEVSSSLDIKYSLQVVADELAKAIDVDAVGIALMNPDMASLTVTAEYYDSKTAGSSLGYKIPIEGNLLTQKVLNERQTVLVEDAQNNPLTEPVHQGMRQRGLNTLYLIPMFAGNKIVGTVGIDIMEKGRLLSPSQLRLAETLVFQAATAVQNAQLYAQAEERAEELTLINAVSDLASSHLELSGLFETVGQLLCGTFAAESLYFALYNKQAETIAFPYFFSHEDGVMDVAPRSFEQGGYTGQIIASRESLLRIVETEAPAEEMKAEGAQVIGSGRETDCYLGTPMIVGNEVIGVLGLSSYREIRTYNKQDQRLLETLADTIGVAVQNIRQFQAAQRQAEREAMINAISQKIQAAPTVERALQTAVAELGQALKLKKAIVKLSTTKEQNGSA